jgi:hypothetical protein
LHWEILRRPEDGATLFTSQGLLFSRYLSSLDWRPVQLRPRGALNVLALAANPTDLKENYEGLAPVDVEGELERLRHSLGTVAMVSIPAQAGGEPRASLASLAAALRKSPYDILYLVCHGALADNEPYLWLEDEQGKAEVVAGVKLVDLLRDLPQRPRLVVLASCQSAGNPSWGEALAALGPRLAQAGIPAVMAMQGNISQDTVGKFMPVFFQELQADGQIDRAMAAARAAVREASDAWMPALYMRLKLGRIWYVPGFGDDKTTFDKWPAIIKRITQLRCTPLLGPGLYESIFGSQKEIARRWAETYHYPMAPHERESLPQVAEFLAVNQYATYPYEELETYLKKDIQTRFAEYLPEELKKEAVVLDCLIDEVGKHQRKQNGNDPYSVLARLPISIYITTNANNLMAAALAEEGKKPEVVLCPWKEYIVNIESVFDREPGYQPSPDRPLVYHLFGRMSDPETIVLTEDDYFDFLIGVTKNNEVIPKAVRSALTSTSLMFAGFQLDDWEFRTLFRSIISRESIELFKRSLHVAVQLEPEEGRLLDLERARRFLEGYFTTSANINLYWGGVADFVTDLHDRWQSRPV